MRRATWIIALLTVGCGEGVVGSRPLAGPTRSATANDSAERASAGGGFSFAVSRTQLQAFGRHCGARADWQGHLNPVNSTFTSPYRVGIYAGVLGSQDKSTSHRVLPSAPSYVQEHDTTLVGLDYENDDDTWSKVFVPSGGDNPEVGDPHRKGESFVMIKQDDAEGGVGTYTHVGPRYLLGGPRDVYASGLDVEGLQGVSAAVRLPARDRLLYPFIGDDGATDMRIKLISSKMTVSDLPPASAGVAQCRYNNNITLENRTTGNIVTVNLRSYTTANDPAYLPRPGSGQRNTADATHYNLYVANGHAGGALVRDTPSNAIVGESFGASHGTAAHSRGKHFNIKITFGQFKNILAALAASEGTTEQPMFGSGWDSRGSWRVKTVAVRMEITGPQEDQRTTRCGGSVNTLKVVAEPRL